MTPTNTSPKRPRKSIERKRKQQKRRRVISLLVAIVLVLTVVALIFSLTNKKNQTDTDNPSQGEGATEFSQIYYFKKDKAKRYDAYQKKNPDMPIEDVVWQVNSSLDEERYVDYLEIDEDKSEDTLVLVNKYNKLPETFEPSELKEVGSGIQMKKEAADAYKKMAKDAGSAEMDIIPQSGYRSYSYQDTLYNNYKETDPEGADTYSARPGFSEHQTGLALDINIPEGGSLRNFVDTKEAEWVAKNAHKYGFIVRYTEENQDITGYMSEPRHIRYIGEKHASNMYDLKIQSYEEYKVKYIDHASK